MNDFTKLAGAGTEARGLGTILVPVRLDALAGKIVEQAYAGRSPDAVLLPYLAPLAAIVCTHLKNRI